MEALPQRDDDSRFALTSREADMSPRPDLSADRRLIFHAAAECRPRTNVASYRHFALCLFEPRLCPPQPRPARISINTSDSYHPTANFSTRFGLDIQIG